MKPPKCRLCEFEHWSGEPCKFEGTSTTKARSPSRPKSAPKSSSGSEPPDGHHGSPSPSTAVTSAAGGTSGTSDKPKKFDRAKYQREFMRKQRKKEREAADKLGITVAEYRARKLLGKL